MRRNSGRPGGRRAGARLALTVGAVLAGIALLAGVGVAAPLQRAGDTAEAVLRGATDDPGGLLRDQGVPLPEAPPCRPPVRACVDLGTEHAWLLDNGRIVRGPVPIVPGDPSTPTPRGRFTVQWKAQEYTSREFLVQMPWSVFFADGGIAFHQGNPATFSRGCVKLGEDDARAFFGFLQVGDAVQIV